MFVAILPRVQNIYWVLLIQTLLDCYMFTPSLTRLIGILTFDIWQTRQNAILIHTNE